MQNERTNSGKDEVLDAQLHWDLGAGSSHASETLWRCDARRAGKLYNRSLFATKAEADQFMAKMRDSETDLMFNVESIKASAVWN